MPSDTPPAQGLGILLISGGHERAHYAFVLATAAAAIGRAVTLFATNQGIRALRADPLDPARDAELGARGVAGLEELRQAAAELGVRRIACEAGLIVADIEATALAPGVEVAGAVTFLAATAGGQVITL